MWWVGPLDDDDDVMVAQKSRILSFTHFVTQTCVLYHYADTSMRSLYSSVSCVIAAGHQPVQAARQHEGGLPL